MLLGANQQRTVPREVHCKIYLTPAKTVVLQDLMAVDVRVLKNVYQRIAHESQKTQPPNLPTN
jgi:hypothetical protein